MKHLLLWSGIFEYFRWNFWIGCFLKRWYPHFTPQNGLFLVGKPIVVGEIHHFRKPPSCCVRIPCHLALTSSYYGMAPLRGEPPGCEKCEKWCGRIRNKQQMREVQQTFGFCQQQNPCEFFFFEKVVNLRGLSFSPYVGFNLSNPKVYHFLKPRSRWWGCRVKS